MAGNGTPWRVAFGAALSVALSFAAPAASEPAPPADPPPAPAPEPAPAEPWADSCGLFQEAVAAVGGTLGPLRALPQEGGWNYGDPAVAHAADVAVGGLSLARDKAAAAAGVDGVPPQLHILLDSYGYSVDYLLRSLSGHKDAAVVRVYLGGYDKSVQDASGFCTPPPPS